VKLVWRPVRATLKFSFAWTRTKGVRGDRPRAFGVTVNEVSAIGAEPLGEERSDDWF